MWKINLEEIAVNKSTATNSRFARLGYFGLWKDGFVLGKFVFNGKNSHLYSPTSAKRQDVAINNTQNEQKMRKIILLFIVFIFNCCSESNEIETIEIMSYYYNLNENQTEFKMEVVNYSIIDENGNVETIQKTSQPENGYRTFQSSVGEKLIGKIFLTNKNRNDEFYNEKHKSLIAEIYCGPTNRVKIKYKNQKEITFNFSDYKTDSKHKEFAELKNIIQSNYSKKNFNKIEKLTNLDQRRKAFEKYSLNKDTLELPFPPLPKRNSVKFIKKNY